MVQVGDVTLVLGIGAAVLLISVIAVRVSIRLGLPSLLLYLGIGVVLGESVLGIKFDDADLTQSLGIAALVLILTEGGLTTRWQAVKTSLWLGVALSTVAVAVSVGRHRNGTALPARPRLADGVAVGRGALVHRRRRSLQRSALAGRGTTAHRRARARVRSQRRARLHRRRAAGLLRPDHVDRAAAGALRTRRGRAHRHRTRLAGRSGAADARHCPPPASTRSPPWPCA